MEYRELLILFVFACMAIVALVFLLAQARNIEENLQTEKSKLLQDKADQNLFLAQAIDVNAVWKKKLEAADQQLLAQTKQIEALQTELGITKQLTAEMPMTRQRVLELERSLAVEQDRFKRFLDGADEEPYYSELMADDDEGLPPLPLIAGGQAPDFIPETAPSAPASFPAMTESSVPKITKPASALLQFKMNQMKRKLARKKSV